MFNKIKKIFSGDPHKKKIDSMIAIVDQINALEPQYEKLSVDALKNKTSEFRARLQKDKSLDDLLPEAFAAVREASKRALGQRHYDVQLICGINLHRGNISEMRTGEGKTLAATLPLYLNALTTKGAHLVTVNDYLARRDGRWMGAIYDLLGMSVGILQMANSMESNELAYLYDPNESSLKEELHHLRPVMRKQAYEADITYGTNSEFGFDYLRDNIAMNWNQRVQRGHHYAIIDEVDNILIDEARTPLIISGPAHEDSENYIRMAQVVRALIPEDFEVSEKDHTVSLTEIGLAHVEDLLGMPLRDPDRPEDITPEQARLAGFLEQSLRAQFLFHRNKEYLVQNGQVVIVDEFTGRLMPGRRWSDGLHQAVEAKEGVKVQAENITHATITIQNYFRMYEKLGGMTGTALTEAEEFYKIYTLDVLAIPTNLEYLALRPDSDLESIEAKDEYGYKFTFYTKSSDPDRKPLYFKRKDYPDIVYRTEEAKIRAIVREIIRFYIKGRPQLVGSTSVENSERLSERLKAEPVRRLIQTLLLRQAWMDKNKISEGELVSSPELSFLNEGLDKLKMPELRRLGSQLGVESLDPLDPTNHPTILRILDLQEDDIPRLLPVFEAGIPHNVLNARKHTEESLIIAGAGAFGAVTIATNMAGRGVDIKLGGELPEENLSVVNKILANAGYEDPYNLRMQDRLEALKTIPESQFTYSQEQVQMFLKYMDEMDKVRELGGLHVIGSERHEARRIDNQLRGRAARQGDPGSSRFFLSLEDELMRLFGGEQVDNMLTRLKIDENMPIESGLVSRLVEGSQTRVEGANFDTRKHLLEYDDVLNEQRKRIYAQRDRIFTKKDLREDVTEMLRTELGNRIKNALSGNDGIWKLLAYLEEIQPSINYTWVSFPSYGLKMVMDHITHRSSEDVLMDQLLQVANQAVNKENNHLSQNVSDLLANSESSLKSQIDERYDALEIFLENVKDDENASKKDLSVELSNLIHIPIRLSATQQKALIDDPNTLKQPLKDSIKVVLTQIMLRRLIMTLERRLNETWNLKPNDLASRPWKEIEKTFVDQVEESLSNRVKKLFGDNGEIAKDLNANREHIRAALTDEGELMRLLILMTEGTVITFDAKSHRRQLKNAVRMNYTFLQSQWLEGESSQQISQDVLSHLEIAEEKFIQVFGNAEWDNLQANTATLQSLSEPSRTGMIEVLGEDEFNRIKDSSLLEISPETKQKVVDYLGSQTQNRIYQRLLLSTITESWVEYLTRMEALRVSISMESYAQRDPLVQYKNEASRMFSELLSEVRAGVISKMFRYRPTQAVNAQTTMKRVSAETPKESASSSDKATIEKTKSKKRKRH